MTNRLSKTVQLTLANTGLLAVGFGALLLLVTWLSDRFMVGHVKESVEAELHIMQAEMRLDGIGGVVSLMDQRLEISSPNHDRLYRLENARGEFVAGNVETWPAGDIPADTPFTLPSQRFPGRTIVQLEWTRFSDGSRLLVGFDEIEVAQVRGDIHRAALWSLGAMLLISLTAGYVLTRAALRPVEAIRAAAERIMEGDLRHRIPSRPNGDEFDRLGETLNSMLDRINTLIASVRGATDNIAHDLRSPLTRHRSRLEAALREPPSPEHLQAWTERNIADLDQVLSTFQSLLRIASVESGLLREEFSACDIPAMIRDAVEFLEPMAEDKRQRIEPELEVGPTVHGHRHLLFQLLVNLLDNAIKYSPEDAITRVHAHADAQGWTLVVADAGPGIPASERQRVFERLYRLDTSRHTPGLGLGLSIVKAIVSLHRGNIVLEDNAPGTRIIIKLPFGEA